MTHGDANRSYNRGSSHPKVTPEQLEAARQYIIAGKSYREAARLSGLAADYTNLYRYFPLKDPGSWGGPVLPVTKPNGEARSRRAKKPIVAVGAGEARRAAEVALQKRESIKQRMLSVIGTQGPYNDIVILLRDMRRADPKTGRSKDNWGVHETVHVLFSLQKGGIIRFLERKTRGPERLRFQDIELTARGRAELGIVAKPKATEPETESAVRLLETLEPAAEAIVAHEHHHDAIVWKASCPACLAYHPTGRPHASAQPTVVANDAEKALEAPVLPEPELAEVVSVTPLLDVLRSRRDSQKEQAKTLTDAARLLDGVDDVMAEMLRNRARVIGSDDTSFTELELEYLAYADSHA